MSEMLVSPLNLAILGSSNGAIPLPISPDALPEIRCYNKSKDGFLIGGA